jgi:hypothetical protein
MLNPTNGVESRRVAQVKSALRQADEQPLGIEKAHGQERNEYRKRPELHFVHSHSA